ncbi:NlpC/P60 family protein [Geomonas azotofigens]|uniref:NlpC/P60 family protein n=1 Tax=Geomonas azotofigens TaxID=2843196 RepID=UPI001C0FB46F|nr:TIGR02594 family protein [Geomonas azotofigens]MBU5614455.1 TIGR02594 family protein [Geomonas azotofigens]
MNGVLQTGSRGPDVIQLQELLNKLLRPQPPLKADGIFGARTENALRRYQAAVGLGIDGVVGPQSWAALQQGMVPQVATLREPVALNLSGAPWVKIAIGEIGQAQVEGQLHNPRILQYHAATKYGATDDETAWCSSFVNWCLKEAGIVGTKSAAATSWLHWGRICGPTVGAITVIYEFNRPRTRSGYHVGFWIEESRSHFKLLGGNQSRTVRISRFPKSGYGSVGYRWPLQIIEKER